MSSDSVEPTRVRLYHRHDAGKNHVPSQWKTPTDFPQKAFLVKTNSDGHELQIRDGPQTDPNGIRSGGGSSRIGPGPDPGSRLAASIDLKTIKSCVYSGHIWIEITDSSGLRRAIEFTQDDPSYVAFYERLTTVLRLLRVKCSTKETFNRAKWFPTSPPASRQLPPVPAKPPTPAKPPNRTHSSSSDEPDTYEYCGVVNRRDIRPSTSDDWPKKPPPPPPSKPSHRGGRQIPLYDDRRHSTESSDNESISNSTNSMISSHRGTLGQNAVPESDGHYLSPIDVPTSMPYANDPPQRKLPPPLPKVKPGPQTKGASSSSSLSSGSDWSCSVCTLWNSPTRSRCEACEEPRKFDADQCKECLRESDFKRRGTSPCHECKSAVVSRSKSLDCNECRRSGHKASPGCKECRTATGTKLKSEDCAECHGAGNRAPIECKECRVTTGNRSNFLDSDEYKRRDQIRTEECSKCISIATIAARKKTPPKKTPGYDANTAPEEIVLVAFFPASPSPATVNVDKWRCKCTCLNPANVFNCSACDVIRHDAWQCQVCDAVINVDVVRCERCDVWRCRLCTYQNDARQNRSRFCQGCQQPQ